MSDSHAGLSKLCPLTLCRLNIFSVKVNCLGSRATLSRSEATREGIDPESERSNVTCEPPLIAAPGPPIWLLQGELVRQEGSSFFTRKIAGARAVLRCGVDCDPKVLHRYISRGEGGGVDAATNAERELRSAERAASGLAVARQALKAESLTFGPDMSWEDQSYLAHRLRMEASRLRPAVAGLRIEFRRLAIREEHAELVRADTSRGVLVVDPSARLV